VGYADTTITPTVGDTLYYFAQDTLTGCVNAGRIDSVVFTVNNLPNDPILSVNDTSICSGSSINIGITNAQSGVTYTIYTDTTAAPVGTAPSSFTPGADVTYYVNASYNSGCTNAGGYTPLNVNVNPLPNSPTLSLSAPAICLGQSLTISVSNPQNGVAYPVYSNSALTNLVGYADTSFSPSASGSLFYFAQDTLTGCVNAGGVDSVSFTVNTLPLAPAFSNNDTSVCAGTTVSLPLINPQTGVTYNVYTDTTLAPIGTAPGAFNPADTTTYYVQAVDNNGCKNAGAFSPYTLNPIALPLNPAVSLSEDSVCNGQSAALTITSPEPNVSYTVYDSQTAGNVLGTTPYTSSYSSSTTVFVEAINSNGCKNAGGRVPVTVTVNPSPVADAGVNQITCPGENVIFTATGGGVYSWNNGNNTASFTLSNVAAAQQGYYTVTVTNSFGCQNKDSVLLTVNNISIFDAADDSSTVDFNASASLDVAINDNGASASSPVIITNPRSGSASVSGSIITYTPNAGFTGTDSLVYQICDNVCANICKTATVYFRVEKEVVIIVPGGVSPNGDGKNDFLDIKGIELFPDNELLIYNRWGDLVFEAKPYKNDWKGQSINAALRVVGDEVTDGTYYYILKLNPQDKGITGFTELRRK
jgi:gliding motility-associated-like protein